MSFLSKTDHCTHHLDPLEFTDCQRDELHTYTHVTPTLMFCLLS